MSGIDARRKVILCRLAEHIMHDLGCAAVTPSKESWTIYNLDAPYRFGWMPPFHMDEDEPLLLMVSFCPELIAETTMWLDDESLGVYLDCIEACIDGMVAQPESDPSVAYNRVQNMIYEVSPASLELVSQVEAKALDEGIVQAG